VERLLALGARHADVGQGVVSWVVLADPEGNEFCVLSSKVD
jgi:predicted enzyme related to lactoylglutathione lyase